MAHNWGAENPVDNARRNSERADRQAQAKAEDRTAEVRAGARNRRQI